MKLLLTLNQIPKRGLLSLHVSSILATPADLAEQDRIGRRSKTHVLARVHAGTKIVSTMQLHRAGFGQIRLGATSRV